MTPVELIKQRISILENDKDDFEQRKNNSELFSQKSEYKRKIKHTENMILLNQSLLKSMGGSVKSE